MSVSYCSFCEESKTEDELDYVCRSCVGQYGAIVLCNVYCKHCKTKLAKDVIVDDDGLHPPKRN